MSYTVNPAPNLHKVIQVIARKTNLSMGEVTVGLAAAAIARDKTLMKLATEITHAEQHAATVLKADIFA